METKKLINIFLPEDSGKRRTCNSTEYHYFNFLFSRNLNDNFKLRFFPKSEEGSFKKMMVSKDTEFSAVIMDFDFRENGDNVTEQKKEISKYATMIKSQANAELYLTSRSWEVWMCMHSCAYTKPFVSQEELNKDVNTAYMKKQGWYRDNLEDLLVKLDVAVKNSKIARKNIMFEFPDYVDGLPDFSSHTVLNNLFKVNTFTYIDLLLCKLGNYTK